MISRMPPIEKSINMIQLGNLLYNSISAFGFDNFAAGCLRDGDKPANMFLQNWPSTWIQEYIANGYGAEDPIIPMVIESPEPFTWEVLRKHHIHQGSRVLNAAEAFGWRDGLIVPIHGPGDERGIVSLAARHMKMTEDDRSFVVSLATRTYHRGRDLDATGGGLGLTNREREALALVATGLDDAAIGKILSISQTTAHAHVERAKRRLGARSRAHAVGIATTHGLL